MSDKPNEADSATLQVAGEETKLNAPETCELDLKDRDPNELNDHVKVCLHNVQTTIPVLKMFEMCLSALLT